MNQVTKQAFSVLGDRGIIRAADNHYCSECTQTYKSQADSFSLFDSAATVGVNKNALVPGLEVDGLEVDMGVIEETPNSLPVQPPVATQTDANADVRMMMVDGIVIGPNVCFYITLYININ